MNQQQNQIKPNPRVQDNLTQENQNDNPPEQRLSNKNKTLNPEFLSMTREKYEDLDEIIKVYPHLKSIKENIDLDCDQLKDCYSFIIRSNNDDDVHKAIKYGVWTSTPNNNENLSEYWKKAQLEKKDIYFFYSVVKSGQFVGVAKLVSDIQEETFQYWWQSNKWKNHFKIEWIFVKDVVYKHFQNLINCKKDPVIRSKDGTEIDWEKTGKIMLKTFKESPSSQTIFNDFEFMDTREKELRESRNSNSLNAWPQHYYNKPYNNHHQQQNYFNNYQNPNPFMMMNMYNMYNSMQYGQPFVPQHKLNNIYPPNSQNQYQNRYQNNYQPQNQGASNVNNNQNQTNKPTQ